MELLDSNILIYGAKGGHPGLNALLDRTDLAPASVTLGYHRLSALERHWLETTFERMQVLSLDDAVAGLSLVNPFTAGS